MIIVVLLLAAALLLLWHWARDVGVIDFLQAEYKADLYDEEKP